MPSKEHCDHNNPVYASIMRGLREATAYEQNTGGKGVLYRMEICFVCYEENGPAIAERIMNTESTGCVSAISVMDSVEAAVSWVISRMRLGFQDGYCLEKPDMDFDRFEAYKALKNRSCFSLRLVRENDTESGDWYDLVVVPRIMNEENE